MSPSKVALVTLKRILVWLTLVIGSIVFSIPFLWMASTSVKVDRELFTKQLTLLPISPHPTLTSPYVDEEYYRHTDVPDQLLDGLVDLLRKTGYQFPTDVDRTTAEQQTARGLYEHLVRILPDRALTGPVSTVLANARKQIDRETVADVFNRIHRRLLLGEIRARSKDLSEQVLGRDLPFSQRLANRTPQIAGFSEHADHTVRCASLSYDFREGRRVILSRTFDLDFPVRDLQRIQIYIRPDDTWHELWLTVEKLGTRYVASRPVPLANFNWTTITWQEPGPDDRPTRIKTWTLLEKAEQSPEILNHPHRLKLALEIRKSTRLRAWWNKLRLNYDRVLDHIPFWRYVRVSVFLVIANVVLTLLSCSLIAYAFARLHWPGRDFCFVLMLATMMIPPQVVMIPHFLIWKFIGAYNTLTPLWLGSAFGNAFFIFLLRQFLKGVPRDLEDAARIDGCGFLRIYWHVMLPLIKPSLAAIAIFTFMATWNDFIGPLIYIADQRLYPLAFGLYAFSVQVGNNPALTMAASLLMTLPVIIIFFFAQRYFIQGITLTGMKT